MFRSRALDAAFFLAIALATTAPAGAAVRAAGVFTPAAAPFGARVSAISPDATVAGNVYAVTYYSLTGQQGVSTCVGFTLSPIEGMGPNSGTWYSNNFPYYGNWVVQGKELRFYGAVLGSSSGTTAYVTHQAKIGRRSIVGYGYDEFDPMVAAVSDGKFTMVYAPNCISSSIERQKDWRPLAPLDTLVQAAPRAAQPVSPDATVAGGTYAVNLYPVDGSPTAYECMTFTQDSSVGLGSNGGTWQSPQFPNFHGNWVVEGKELRFYGLIAFSSGGVASYYTYQAKLGKRKITGYGYDDFNPSLVNFSDGRIKMAYDASCDGGPSFVRRHAAP